MDNKQLVEEVKKMAGYGGEIEKKDSRITYYKERWGYVLSGQGETYTQELAEKWGNAKRAGKSYNYFVKDCARWFGRRIADCSGMIVEAIRQYDADYGDRTANTFRNQFRRSGAIGSLPETPGLAVWKSGHIGIYIGGGKVIEARGYKYGVVESTLKSQSWKTWGEIKGIEYGETAEIEETPVFTRELQYKSEMMRGEDVRALQSLLTKAGQKPGAIDGIFGTNTRDAVKSFQRERRLSVDGIAGEKTVEALGGIWKGTQGAAADKPAAGWSVARLLKKTSPLMKGDDIKNLQKALIAAGYSCGTQGADGEYGSATESAVKKFQKAKGLNADGKAGEKTVEALGGIWKG